MRLCCIEMQLDDLGVVLEVTIDVYEFLASQLTPTSILNRRLPENYP